MERLKQTCTKEQSAIACRIAKKENYALIYVNLEAPDEEIMKSLIVASSKIVEVKNDE